MPHISVEDYLEIERRGPVKHEYFRGEIYAMSGSSEEHNLITTNVIATLHAQLRRRPCRVYPSDMRVRVRPTGLYTYPDVTVVCGLSRFDDSHQDTLLNPTLIVEVLSPSTAAYDRGEKAEQYRRLDSLQEYLLIAQDRVHVEHYRRQPDNQWLLTETDALNDSLDLPAIECQLLLADLYEKVQFGEE
jgi:Uma2 family endonuclease